MAIEFTTDLITGFEEIDDQHRQLFEKANAFFYDADSGQSDEKLVETLNFLVEYVKFHFAEENNLMRQSSYPRSEDHIKSHKLLVEKLVNIYRALIAEGPSKEIFTHANYLIRHWLVNHVQDSDKRLATYLKAWRKSGAPTS